MSDSVLPQDPALPAGGPRTLPMSDVPALAEKAADLLRTPHTMLQLTPAEAATVVAHMRLVNYPAGATVFREGDDSRSSYLLLILQGEVSVDTSASGERADAVAISVLGPGSVIGEMALIDGSARSTTCTAMSAVQAAGLSRKGLEVLVEEHPKAAAKLLLGLCKRIGDRLRALGDQLQMYAGMR